MSNGDHLGSKPPLVSCIMPTANRRRFVPQAIAAFQGQDYEPRELIIIDDGSEAISDLLPEDDRIRYVRRLAGQSLGNKRNEACRLARGEIIVHWDDDDWHANWRVSYQVGELLGRKADICGLDRVWFYDAQSDRAWQYRYSAARPSWLAGGTFCYKKQLWEHRQFRDVSAGEDTRFVREVGSRNLLALERDDFYVARIHANNTSSKPTSGPRWHPADAAAVRALVEAVAAGSSPPVAARPTQVNAELDQPANARFSSSTSS